MTSSFTDPATVRFNFHRQYSSPIGQQPPSSEDQSYHNGHNDSQTHLQHTSQQSLDNSQTQYFWQNQDTSCEDTEVAFLSVCTNTNLIAWSNGTNVRWYYQAFPGAHGDEHVTSQAWDHPTSQTYSNFASGGSATHIEQPRSDTWFPRHSYHSSQDMLNRSAAWNPPPIHPDYSDAHRNEYCHSIQSQPSFNSGNTDTQYSDMSESQFENTRTPMNTFDYSSTSANEAQVNYYGPENNNGVWEWSRPSPVRTESHVDNVLPETSHTPATVNRASSHNPNSYISRVDTWSPRSSSLWDIDGNASHEASNYTVPADLVPSPPTKLLDPPPEDMDPSDKAMIPQKRNLKDPNHLYMPRWIRGDGKQREGWCGACRPGKWLSLKRSTYWCMIAPFHEYQYIMLTKFDRSQKLLSRYYSYGYTISATRAN